MIQPISRSRSSARVSPRFARLGVLAVLAVVMIATLVPAAVVAADHSPAPDRLGGVRVIPERTPDRGVAVDPVPVGAIGVQSSIGYQYGDDSVAVVGEVFSNATIRRKTVVIQVDWYNGSNASIGTNTTTVVLDSVARGGVGPFLLFVMDPPAGIATFTIKALSSVAVQAPAVGVLEILDATSSVVGDVRRFEGTIHNPNSFAVTGVTAMVTAYHASGDVLDVSWTLPNDGSLAAGASAPYVLDIATSDDAELAYHHASILADGFRSGSSTAYVTSFANYFDDISTTTFRNAIIWLAEQGITAGCAAGKYCPSANVRRDEMATFLSRAMGLPAATADYFTDDTGNTHEASINKLREAAITGGCTPTTYCPASPVRRDAMASFLSRALDLPPTSTNHFTDDNGNTHEANINRLAEAGITGGCSATTYCPTANVTRAQMAAFLRRAFE